MRDNDLVYWLLDNAGPAIRYRTIVDLMNEQDVGTVARALSAMSASEESIKWLGLLTPDFDFNALHSSRQDALENVIPKLVQLGWRAGLQPFDSKTLPFRVWLSENIDKPYEKPHSLFIRTLIASLLARAGYDMVEPVERQMNNRLEELYQFAQEGNISQIYVEKPKTKRMSETTHKLVDPNLCSMDQFSLPWIHDVLAFCNIRSIMKQPEKRKQVERVMMMILTPEYQSLPWGYGLGKFGERYYAIGWSVHLSGYGSRPEEREFADMLQILEGLAPYTTIQDSSWFNDSLDYLETFRTENGTYLFPRAWLPELKIGYWVGGSRMAYDSRKGLQDAIEVESTFRVLMIRKRSGI